MKPAKTLLLMLFILLFYSDLGCWAAANDIEFTPAEKSFIKQHPVIKLGVDPQFVPYEFFDSDGQYKGIAADYINLLNQKTRIKMEIARDLTWPEAYEKAVERELDALPCISKTPEREAYFLFSDPYFSFQRVIIVQEANSSVKKLEDLFNKKVALKENSSHHSYLKSFGSIRFSLYPTEEAALKALAEERESYFVGNFANSSYQIKTNGLTGLKIVQMNSDNNQQLYFAVRKDWPLLVGIINKGLAGITKEEKIEINNRWIGIQNQVDYKQIIQLALILGGIILIIIMVSWYWIIKLRKEVSERVKAEDALKIAKEEAELANQFKSVFLARMSHEIRTHLNAITGMAYLIKKTDITKTQGIYLDKIVQAARNMLGIINDILDFSKIEAGKIELERVSFNLDKVLQQVTNIVSFRIEEQGLDFIIKKDPLIPDYFWGDPTRLEQVLLNVINNAVKFTQHGQIVVIISLLSRNADVYTVELSVKDTGIGMTAEQMNRLFTPFDQGDSSINRRFGGTGLGLSIVKNLVDMMGGEIRVFSTPGKGSTFNIQLALEVDNNAESMEKQLSSNVILKGVRVLVLEKSPEYIALLKEYLESFNMSVDFAESDNYALDLLSSNISPGYKPYDLLLIDNETPGEGGLDFAKRIKTTPLIPKKPKIILLVPLMREDIIDRAGGTAIDLSISKPIIASILFDGIIELFKDKVLDHHERSTYIERPDGFVSDFPYHILVVEDNKTNQFIAQSILEQAGFKVSLAGNGKTGYEIFKKHREDLDLILMDLHMPVLNGYEASMLIRELNKTIPIVAMTADAIKGVEEKCSSVGIDHYISKPFDPDSFAVNVWKILNPKRELPKTPLPETSAPEAVVAPDLPVLDENEGIKLLGGNQEFYIMVLNEYYLENKDVLDKLSGSIAARQYEDAVQIVHKIKSSSGNIGSKQLFAVASDLQKALSNADEAQISIFQKQFEQTFINLFELIRVKINQG